MKKENKKTVSKVKTKRIAEIATHCATGKPAYNFPSTKKATALPYEIYGGKKRKTTTANAPHAITTFMFALAIASGVAVIIFDNFILPTWGI